MTDCNKSQLAATLVEPQRNNYFYGKLLDKASFCMEQSYFNHKRWMLNRLGLGSGVLCGLQVTVSQDGKQLCISAGVAVDAIGREIVVPEAVLIDPIKITDDRGLPIGEVVSEGDLYVCLAYCEYCAEPVPVLVTDCDSTNKTAPDVIRESFRVLVLKGSPPELPEVPDEELCNALSEKDAEARRKKVCEVLWSRTCSTGEGQRCVVLAGLSIAEGKITIKSCDARPLVYSNPELFEMLMCRVEGGSAGPQGPPGPAGQGIDRVERVDRLCTEDPTLTIVGASPNRTLILGIPPGCDGKTGPQGPPGQGFDDALTKITKINWQHDGNMTWQKFLNDGLRIEFSDRVIAKPDHDRGWFLVSFELNVGKRNSPPGNAPPWLQILYLMFGLIWPEGTTLVYRSDIKMGSITGLPPASGSTGLYAHWQLSASVMPLFFAMLQLFHTDLRVLVRVVAKCDFLIDKNGKCVDGNHLGGSLRSNKETGDRVGGGEFESWFELVELPKPGIATTGSKTHMLSAKPKKSEMDALEKILPGIAELASFFKNGG